MLAAAAAAPAQVVPIGPEFQVNTYTTGDQADLDVATSGTGNVVIVWEGPSSTADPDGGIQGQRYDAAGLPVGGEFQINSVTTSSQLQPGVASDTAGNFVVVWASLVSAGTDTSSLSVQARRFDSTGIPLGAEFQVNTYTTGYQSHPDVATETGGNFVVVWRSAGSAGSDTSSSSIQAQRFDSTGTPLGGEFQVNTYTTSAQQLARVAINAGGDFLIAWESDGSAGSDTSSLSTQGQRFDSSGTPLGSEFQVNTYTTGVQSGAHVAIDTTGNFVVVWNSTGSAGSDQSGASIQGQRYDSSGLPLGGEFEVNSYTTGGQAAPAVAADPTGNFVVVWVDLAGGVGSDLLDASIQGRRFDSTGTQLGSQFQVNTYTTGDQDDDPRVAPDAAGNFVVVWRSDGSSMSDSSGTSIQGQREGPARILGKKLIVRDPTGDESRRTVVALGKETSTDMGPLILGDPTVSGATLRIVTVGTTPADQTYALDASGWQPLGAYGYLYRGPTGGDGDPVQRVRIKRTPRGVGLLQVMLRGGLGTQSLDIVPPNLGDEGALALTVNGGGTYCVGFGGTAGGIEVDDSATRWKIINATGQGCP
jgi:hypothetical protein